MLHDLLDLDHKIYLLWDQNHHEGFDIPNIVF